MKNITPNSNGEQVLNDDESLPNYHQKKVEHIEAFAKSLDKNFTFPGTSIKFGWDSIIGLIPGVGDSLTAMISSYLLFEAHKLGVPFFSKVKMVWNIFLDWLIGLIPLFGDIFDVAWRANQKNANIIISHLKRKQRVA